MLLCVGAWLLVPAYVAWYPARLAMGPRLLESPTFTDALFIAGYTCFLIGLGRDIGRRTSTDRWVDVLDTLIIGVGLGVLVWVGFIGPYLQADDMSWGARVTAISYTVLNLLLLGAVVRLLVQGGIASRGDRLLVGWVVAQLAADLVYAITTLGGTFSVQDPAVGLYPVSFVLLGAALLHPTTMADTQAAASRPAPGARRFMAVVPAALIAPVVLVGLGVRNDDVDVVVVALLAAALFGLVLWRVWLLFVDVEEHRRTQDKLTRSIDQERRRTLENQELLASLSERQILSDRLSRIQRKISTRAPLQEVLDAITQGAADLVHADVRRAPLRRRGRPRLHGHGVLRGRRRRGLPRRCAGLPLGVGVGGRAIVTNSLCIQDAYTGWDDAIAQFAASGLQTALAAPVHLGSEPIGSLVVATHRADRRYSTAEQDALISFAEHVEHRPQRRPLGAGHERGPREGHAPGHARRAHRAAEPGLLLRPGRAGAAGRQAGRDAPPRCCSSTSTGSRRSTTPSATATGTGSCAPSGRASHRCSAGRHPRPARRRRVLRAAPRRVGPRRRPSRWPTGSPRPRGAPRTSTA